MGDAEKEFRCSYYQDHSNHQDQPCQQIHYSENVGFLVFTSQDRGEVTLQYQCYEASISSYLEYLELFSSYFQRQEPREQVNQRPILNITEMKTIIAEDAENSSSTHHTLKRRLVYQWHSMHLALEDIALQVSYHHHSNYHT